MPDTSIPTKKIAAFIVGAFLLFSIADAQISNPIQKRLYGHLPSNHLRSAPNMTGKKSVDNNSKNAPCIKWQKCYGGSNDEIIQTIIKLADGNYLSCGGTNSQDGDFIASHGGLDAFLMKTDRAGNIIWKKTYGGSGDDFFYDMVESNNGDIVVVGSTTSNDGQVSGNHGGEIYGDVWLVTINSKGKLLSQHCYGGTGDEYPFDVILTKDNKIAFAGQTSSNDGDVSNNHGDIDGWVVELKQTDEIKFSTCIGGPGYDDMSAIHEINNQFVVTGTRASVPSTNDQLEKYYDAHAALLDKSGKLIWYHVYGGSRSDDANFSVLSKDGNCVITGHTSSHDGDVADNNGFNSWVWKIDVAHNGNIIWQTHFGIVNDTAAGFNIFPTRDGGFVVVGAIAPNELEPFDTWDAYIGKVNANGVLLWTKQFGGSDFDAIGCGVEESDGSLLLGGWTNSNDGDVSGNHGAGDAWLVNLDDNGCNHDHLDVKNNFAPGNLSLNNFPNPFSNSTTISFSLPQSEKVLIRIFDVTGRLVKIMANEQMQAGIHQLTWNAADENGNPVRTGIYFLRMEAGSFSDTKKLVVLK